MNTYMDIYIYKYLCLYLCLHLYSWSWSRANTEEFPNMFRGSCFNLHDSTCLWGFCLPIVNSTLQMIFGVRGKHDWCPFWNVWVFPCYMLDLRYRVPGFFDGLICFVSEDDLISLDFNGHIGSKIFTVLPFIYRAMCAQWITRLCTVSFLHGHLTPWILCMWFWCSYQLESGFQCDICLPCALSSDFHGCRHLRTSSLGCVYLSWNFPRINCLFAFRSTVRACRKTNLLRDFNSWNQHRVQSLTWI